MIDWDRVRDLKAEIGEDDFAEVVELFLEEADEVMARLCADHGPQILEKDLHFLKGAALNLGFAHLAMLCQQGERRAAGGSTEVELDPVRLAYAVSKRTFQASDGTAAA
ncbi:MAG: Hpt domain-containing protein [Paracoccaceae bacterium]